MLVFGYRDGKKSHGLNLSKLLRMKSFPVGIRCFSKCRPANYFSFTKRGLILVFGMGCLSDQRIGVNPGLRKNYYLMEFSGQLKINRSFWEMDHLCAVLRLNVCMLGLAGWKSQMIVVELGINIFRVVNYCRKMKKREEINNNIQPDFCLDYFLIMLFSAIINLFTVPMNRDRKIGSYITINPEILSHYFLRVYQS